MLTVAEAEAEIGRHVRRFPDEDVPLAEAAGCVLREPIAADRDLPPFDRATMDGIAIAGAAYDRGQRTFAVEATQAAGQPAARLQDHAGGCLEIMTGAMLPDGADTVVPYEEIEVKDGRATIRPDAAVRRGQHLHRRAADRRAGDPLLGAGRVLRSPQLAIVASTGRATVRVAQRPAIAVVSVGDELVDVGQPAEIFQIRPSNAHGIRAALQGLGWRDVELALLRDDPAGIEGSLAGLLQRCDVLILSGGVSKGMFDFVPRSLARLGVREVFHRVQQKPGKPMWFGVGARSRPVFALPGNPVSTTVCFHRYVLPYLQRCLGASPAAPQHAALGTAITVARPLTHFLPVRLEPRDEDVPVARLQAYHGSGDYASLGESDGFVELPSAQEVYPAGAVVRYHPWHV